jgi:hypothetical protein
MRKYTDAPKDIADAIKNAIPVSKEVALGDGWKKLPVGRGARAKGSKKIVSSLARHVAMAKKKAVRRSAAKIKMVSLEVKFGGVHLKVQGTPSASYAKGLAKAMKDYIKAHPVKA